MTRKSAASAPPPLPVVYLPPLKPRPKWFGVLMALFVLWCIALAAMYAFTVYPHPESDPHRKPPATMR